MNQDYRLQLGKRLQQQEKIVSQLLHIVANTNEKVTSLQSKIDKLERSQWVKKI